MSSKLMIFLLTPLVACSDKGAATDDTQSDTQVTTPYGPDNAWYHAPDASLVPEEPAEDQWVEGEQVPNLRFTDQNGDEVWLYQFFGQTIYLDWAAEWCGPCHSYAPYFGELNQEYGDRAVVITVLLQNGEFEPGDADTVARWVAEHGSDGPILWLDAEQAARVQEPDAWPQVDLVDPGLRLAQVDASSLHGDAYLDQIADRMILPIGGSLDNPAEVCGDGFDNDLDLIADCMDPACAASCEEASTTGSITPCTPDADDNKTTRVDVWRVTVTSAVAAIESDNIAEATGFEHLIYAKEEGQSWDEARLVGDDEWSCTWALDTFGCARGWLRPGTWEIMVHAGTGGSDEYDGDCVDPSLGEYTLRALGDVTFALIHDDVERQSL